MVGVSLARPLLSRVETLYPTKMTKPRHLDWRFRSPDRRCGVGAWRVNNPATKEPFQNLFIIYFISLFIYFINHLFNH